MGGSAAGPGVLMAMAGKTGKKSAKVQAGDDRRAVPRFALLMRTAKLICESGEYLAIVRDVSAGGARLVFMHDAPPDTHLYLELANGDRYAMENRWYRNDEAGFRFASWIDVSAFIEEPSPYPRRPLRLKLQRPALVTAGGRDTRATLVNLSQQGARIETGSQIEVGEYARLEVDGLPVRFGQICWRDEFSHGLAFDQAFRLEEFARHLHALQPFVISVAAQLDQGSQAAANGG
ncbi:MAG: PilZ domain-containing protein [Novosphingobium sp.]|nr:PilZ domain-containing protein [Novosphingobium sp.]MCP5401095.1 PilZ domain-containing protein [Novosphingobium sp.]